MERTIRVGWTAVAVGVALLATATPTAGQEPIRGTWTADLDDRPHVQLRTEDGHGMTSMPRDDAEAMLRQAGPAGEVRWTVTREAGTLAFEGTVSRRRGRGVFTFRPDPAFRDAMDAQGYGRPTDRDLLHAAVHDLTRARVGELADAGVPAEDFDQLVASAVFDVDGAFVAEMRALGLRPDLEQLVAFRIHGVSADWVEAMREAGVRGDERDLIAFRIHGVTPAFARTMRGAGLGALDGDDLVAFRIHGVTPGFLEDVRAMGFATPSRGDALSMRIHGVDRAFVEAMREAGVPPRDADQAVAFRIHGVTPDLARELRERGFDDVDGEDLIRIRIHGMDRFVRRRPGG